MIKWFHTAVALLLLLVIVAVGYKLAISHMEVNIYRGRLASLTSDYESLRATYNEAVARTAVTELVVKEGRLSVAIRTIHGIDRVIETPFDPAREIYCDYVILDGRLWIRRVYDSHTPASSGLVIDSSLETVNWKDPAIPYGIAVYRPLGEGRWVVTVTGDGSLGLAKVKPETVVVLSGPPPVRDYEQMKKQIDESIAGVTIADVMKGLFAPSK